MIIRSQDKMSIINFDNIENISIDFLAINYFSTNSVGTLGEYSTKEKVIKVLDMICKAYENYRGGNVYEYSIFNMPQDSEV